jgi:SAM-dependent methyltransferase
VKYCSDRCRMNRKQSDLELDKSVDNSKKFLSALLGVSFSMLTMSTEVEAVGSARHWTSYNVERLDAIDKIDFTPTDFERLDESDDAIFYQSPRFVEHIDTNAVQELTIFQTEKLQELANEQQRKEGIDVLDLCSSWTSHISSSSSLPLIRHFAVLGMNEAELQRNPLMTEYVVRDLNIDSHLPFADNSFDCILLQLSIDYLTHPIEVMRETHRVLRDHGHLLISFSNRLFLDKAVAVWTGKSNEEHKDIVVNYLFQGGFDNTNDKDDLTNGVSHSHPIQVYDLITSRNADPLFVVEAFKSSN